MSILTINAGSSSIRFAIFTREEEPVLEGKVDRVGHSGATLEANRGGKSESQRFPESSPNAAADALVTWLSAQPEFGALKAVGHRVVHGMHRSKPERVTPKLLRELRKITPYDPEHLPLEIRLMDAVARRYPRLQQIACFDTAFHRAMPDYAKIVPIPRRFRSAGIERYGFHGISYSYLMEQLTEIDPREALGRVILAHLGNGASMAAVLRGKSIETTMAFTPGSGLVMGTRTGDVDPGLAYFLSRVKGVTPAQFQHIANHESGLLGISGISSDVRDLSKRRSSEPLAALALEVFCYQARKSIGALAAALGGLDTLVFAGGIGENAHEIRARICANMDFLGVKLSDPRNRKHAPVISSPRSPVTVRVIRTNEERMIVRAVRRFVSRL